MSIALVTAGFTGVGKTTFVKQQIAESGMPEFIFDIHKEYKMNGSFYGNFRDFTKAAKQKKSTFIVFEEATIFFKQQGIVQDVMDILVNKRHMGEPNGSIIMFNFHSLRKIPLDILDLVNYLVIFKTNDMPHKVLARFGDEYGGIYEAYEEVNDSDNPHEKRVLKLN